MATLQLPDSLVSVDWLKQHLDDDNLVILDSSWHMPATGRDGFREWQQEHIPGGRFFDFDRKISDPDSPNNEGAIWTAKEGNANTIARTNCQRRSLTE